MSTHDSRGNALMNSIDSTGTMVTKTVPALIGTGFSFTSVPWADVAAFLTCLYTSFLISEWVYKKVLAFRQFRKDKKAGT